MVGLTRLLGVCAVLACALLPSSEAGLYGKGSGVKTLTDSVFPGKDSQKTWFVEFYAPWCGHCKALQPKWTEMAKTLEKEGSDIQVGAVDCTENQQICQQHGVQGYPTIKLLTQGKAVPYNGPREVADMVRFAKSGGAAGGAQGGGGPPPGGEGAFYGKGSGVKTLTDAVFPGKDSDKIWFVEFYAPWCGHCKALKPKWMEMAKTLEKAESKVKVGAVDCTKNQQVCQQHGVQGYPTIKLLNKGKAQDYNGPREANDLVRFAMKAAGETPPSGGAGGAAGGGEKKKKAGCDNDGFYTANSGVETLCEGRFPGKNSKYTWMVEFYAPWCGHCQALKPKWKEAAKMVDGDERVRFGAVDCTKNQELCQRYGVQGYPTIKLVKQGVPTDYNGPREAQPLVDFAKARA